MRTTAVLIALVTAGGAAGAPVDYTRQIKPLLAQRCAACHGALAQKAKLRLDTAALIRKGGRSGPAVVPGKSGESPLIEAVLGETRRRMPPDGEGAPLGPEQIDLLRAWIDQGASGPADEPVPEDPRKHWAFQRPVRPPVPVVDDAEWRGNPIDAFVAAEHQKRGLRPRPRADRATLLRRVTIDLTGLPPTRDELHAFLGDQSTDAYEKVVDRLLASPAYGERWGRHWMDVWRYSDWYGRRQEKDWRNSAPQIWRWRDWIVRSLNEDKGYDRMLREMLAADEIAPEDEENLVATGFLVRNFYSLNYHQWKRDIVEHTGKAFLGLTLNCCHCHDHKYDPVSNQEYFAFRAFFEPIELRQDRVPGEPDPGPFVKYVYGSSGKVVTSGTIRVMDEYLDARTYFYRRGDERDRDPNRPPVAPAAPAVLGGADLKIVPVELPPAAYYPGLKPWVQREEIAAAEKALADAKAAAAGAAPQLDAARRERDRAEALAAATLLLPPATAASRARLRDAARQAEAAAALAPLKVATAEARLAAVKAVVAADRVKYKLEPGDPAATARGAGKAQRFQALCVACEKQAEATHAVAAAKARADAAGLKKAEQALAAASAQLEQARKNHEADGTTYAPLGPVYPAKSSGRRRALAEWIGSNDNPLTARVAVNHVWLRHFGRPLVESVYDFGRNGKRPSHPELLDWLAVEFMAPSPQRTPSSGGEGSVKGWSMKALHRLIVTSRAYQSQSGPGADDADNLAKDTDNRYLWHFGRRRVEAEVVRDAMLHLSGELDPTLGGPTLEPDQELASRRRTMYFSIHPEEGEYVRTVAGFDVPDACDCYRRTESLLPQQALALTNSAFVHARARALAARLWAAVGAGGDEAFIVAAFEHLLTRRPAPDELAACREFLRAQAGLLGQRLGPAGGDPAARARAGLVRVLFNHGDFITLR